MKYWVGKIRMGSGCLMLMFVALATPAQAATYSTSMSAVDWHSSQSIFSCELSYSVTGFGSANFFRAAGEKERFHLQQKSKLLPVGEARISSSLPNWHAESVVTPLAKVTVTADTLALRTDEVLANHLRTELVEGKRILITSEVNAGDASPVRVVVEALKFRAAHQQYLDCFKQLLPVSLADVARTTLYYDGVDEALSAAEQQKLKWLVIYAKADPRVKHIYIDGHTDSPGERPANLDIAKSRAETVTASLVDAGVKAGKITTRWHGERYPVATNKTEKGRQKNRRVTLRLELAR